MSNTVAVKKKLEEYVNSCIEKSKKDLNCDECLIKACGAVEFSRDFLANVDVAPIEKRLKKYISETF